MKGNLKEKCQVFKYLQRNKPLVIENIQFAVTNKRNISATTKKWKSAVCHVDISCKVQIASMVAENWGEKINGLFFLQ